MSSHDKFLDAVLSPSHRSLDFPDLEAKAEEIISSIASGRTRNILRWSWGLGDEQNVSDEKISQRLGGLDSVRVKTIRESAMADLQRRFGRASV
jgi:DNA-directed RNA polymerase sigma subunit (sigma70/sigma32)